MPVQKISVVTVCYEPGPILLDAIQSVHAQDFAQVEHVIIDGGSKDGTVDRVSGLLRAGDVLVSEPDKGIYDAMNKGVARATGDVIALLNADDRYADPGVLSRVAAQFDAAGTDAVLGDVSFFKPGAPEVSIRRYNSGMFKPERIGWGWMPAHPAMVLTREAYDRVGPYRTDYRIAADFEFIVRAFREHGLSYSYLRDVFVKMQVGGVSTSGASARKTINREMLRACKENGIASNPLMMNSRYLMKALELVRR
ncbi:glycosyltransferase family 2 protein [Sphingomonas sp. AOB5]|uniref:glycosyltransferase family 2 protein n=1 Tax=Sphingomonas sp. AOB5 TaxID=3034017 RepID=UPI0023F91831|nr:glycosyltransferase family 2 protein [Sphingomonas sp. AOB5]MDF7775431.1 glycosyltransferase family 2 protein [Sphingomonas sp. AOB5]